MSDTATKPMSDAELADLEPELSELLDETAVVIRRLGGCTTPRELGRHMWAVRAAADANMVLSLMAERGYGFWQTIRPGPRGGRPSRVFVLAENSGHRRPQASTEPAGN
jgi:hypothetical protein